MHTHAYCARHCTRATAEQVNFLPLQSLHSSGEIQTETNRIQVVKSALKINRRNRSVVREGLFIETWMHGVGEVWTVWAPWKSSCVCDVQQGGQREGAGEKKRINQELSAQGSSQRVPGCV